MASPLIHEYAAHLYKIGQNTQAEISWYTAKLQRWPKNKTLRLKLVEFKYAQEIIREEFNRVCEQD